MCNPLLGETIYRLDKFKEMFVHMGYLPCDNGHDLPPSLPLEAPPKLLVHKLKR